MSRACRGRSRRPTGHLRNSVNGGHTAAATVLWVAGTGFGVLANLLLWSSASHSRNLRPDIAPAPSSLYPAGRRLLARLIDTAGYLLLCRAVFAILAATLGLASSLLWIDIFLTSAFILGPALAEPGSLALTGTTPGSGCARCGS